MEGIDSFLTHDRTGNCRCDACFHLGHGLFEADEHRACYDAMPDVQLFHSGNAGDRRHILIIESVPCMKLDSGRNGGRGGNLERL